MSKKRKLEELEARVSALENNFHVRFIDDLFCKSEPLHCPECGNKEGRGFYLMGMEDHLHMNFACRCGYRQRGWNTEKEAREALAKRGE